MNQRARAPAARTTAASQTALLHELHVHQIELEIQNEELRRAQAELAGARDRFVDLYDFAPVGYFTLDAQGVIAEANLTGAAILGEERMPLLGGPLARFIHVRDRERWRRHLRHTLRHDGVQRIELLLQPRAVAPLHAQFDCLRVVAADARAVLRVTLTDITQRKLAEVDRRIAIGAVDAREDERRSVARELHDELGQRLSALKMALASLRQDAGAAECGEQIDAMLVTLGDAVAMVRRIATDLRPLLLDDLGLNAAIDWLARDAARRSGLDVRVRIDDDAAPLGERTSTSVFRLVQEGLAQIASHARGRAVAIELQRRPDELVLVLEHDGTGWPEPDVGASVEPAQRLRDRVHLLGGALRVDDAPDGARRITIHLPLPQTGDAPAT